MKEMKFALKLRNIYIISILAAIALFGNLNAQQTSFVKNNHFLSVSRYTFPNHLGIEKTYSISQNNLGILFFSTNKGIISFDGHDWGVVNFNKKAFLTRKANTLYIFSDNYTGEVYREANSSYSIKEVKVNYPFNSWTPTGVECYGDTVCVVANNKIWIFSGNTFKAIDTTSSDAYLFTNRQNLFLCKNEKILVLQKGQFVPMANPLKIKKGIKYFNSNHNLPVYSGNKELILSNDIGNNSENEISLPLDEDIVTTYADEDSNLWVLSEKALYCIKAVEYFKLIAHFPSLKNPLTGIASDSTGVYCSDNNTICSSNYTLKHPNISYICSLGNNILISEKNGIFELLHNKLLNLVSRPVSFSIKIQDKLFFISKGVLYSLRFNNNTFSVKELINLKTDSIQKIIQKSNEDLLVLDKQNRIYLLKASLNGYSRETLFTSENTRNTPVLENIFKINNDIFASNSFNIFKLEGNVLINQEASPIEFPLQGHFIDYFEADTNGNIVLSSCRPGEKKRVFYGKKMYNSRFNWFEIPLWETGLKYPDILTSNGKEIVLFEDGRLFSLLLDKFFGRSEKVIITTRQIAIDNKPLLPHYRKSGKELIPYFDARYPVSLITLKFQAIDLTDAEYTKYSFLLEKKEVEWSPWSNSPEKNFSNLPPGEYKLFVKAQTINGSISNPFVIRFRILPPFYLQWYAWIVYIILFIGILGLVGFSRKKQFEKEKIKLESIIQERTSELTREKEKTDELLANMLPKDTAEELKNTGKATSHKFDMVTVLFSDIQGFTKIAEQMNPEKLIDELDNFFFQFDSVVEKYNIEKIKTIGDAYMAAGGIPYKNRTNPVEVVLAALEMQEYMKTLKLKNSDIWDLRIGVHTGAVIAGVVGHKRISYDIWGDTVNTASRMESSGEASKINISGQTYELVKEFFICEYRGKMPVKYKGDIDMYFVKGVRPELSVNLRSIPSKKFFIQLQLLRILDLEEFIFNRLEAELPKQYVFHNLKHTKDVYTQTELLGRAENITSEEMLLLRTTALLHDTGFIYSYQNHEIKSQDVCKEVLPKFKYSAEQIETICSLILCTRKNTVPANKLEEILIDANTDYLGRIDYISMISNLFKEAKLNRHNKNEEEWLTEQIFILENHDFYTETARRLREVTKNEQIQKIKDHLKLHV